MVFLAESIPCAIFVCVTVLLYHIFCIIASPFFKKTSCAYFQDTSCTKNAPAIKLRVRFDVNFSVRIRSVPDRCSQEHRAQPRQNGSRSQAPTGARSDRSYKVGFETLFSLQKYHQPCPDRQLLSFLPFRIPYYSTFYPVCQGFRQSFSAFRKILCLYQSNFAIILSISEKYCKSQDHQIGHPNAVEDEDDACKTAHAQKADGY